MIRTQQPSLKFPFFFPTESNSFQSAKREVKTNPTISFPSNSSRASSATEEGREYVMF